MPHRDMLVESFPRAFQSFSIMELCERWQVHLKVKVGNKSGLTDGGVDGATKEQAVGPRPRLLELRGSIKLSLAERRVQYLIVLPHRLHEFPLPRRPILKNLIVT